MHASLTESFGTIANKIVFRTILYENTLGSHNMHIIMFKMVLSAININGGYILTFDLEQYYVSQWI